jgi:hypothetical protein
MSVENERGRPREDLTSDRNSLPQQSDPRQGGSADTPLAPVLGERGSRGEQSHEDLVAAFRTAIRQKQREWQERGENFSPAHIIQSELFHQAQFRFMRQQGEYAHYKQLGEFYFPILQAWDVIAYEHYGEATDTTGPEVQHFVRVNLTDDYKRTGQSTIRLSERQTRVLDALAEAADIPHQKGQMEIDIPENLRNYEDQA